MSSDQDLPGGGGSQGPVFVPATGADSDPPIRLNRNRKLYGNVRVLWRNFVPDAAAVTAPSLPGFEAENLRWPGSSLKWGSPDLSDLAHLQIDLGDAPRPITTFVLHDANLSTRATIRLRGDDSQLPADLVALPAAEIGRGGAVQGLFDDIAHGIDAATSGSITLPPGQAYAVSIAAPSASPLPAADAGLVRLRLRPSVTASKATVRVEILQAGGTYITVETELELATIPSGSLLQVPFDPGSLPNPEASVELRVTHASGSADLELEEIDLVFEVPTLASAYDSRWVRARDALPSELANVIEETGGYGTVNVSHLLTQPRRHRYWQLSIRDGLNSDGFFQARSCLGGLHFGTAELLPLTAESPRLDFAEDVQTLLSGAEVRSVLGRPKRTFPIQTQVPLVLGLHEVFHGAPTEPCAVWLWPGNGLADQPLTLVGKLTDLETELDDGSLHADRIRFSMTFREI